MAIEQVKATMDLAAEMECDYVGIWSGQDGYDSMLEVDYQKVYEWWVKGIQECADHNPSVRLGLEYKPFEPRARSFINANPKTLLLRDIQRENVGFTVDVGHFLFAHEYLGEVVALSQMHNQLFHIHLNDNYSDWDWDMNFGSVHTLVFIEMIYWLMKTNYQGRYSVDILAYRTNSADSIAENLKWLQALMGLVDQAGLQKFDEVVAACDPIVALRFLRELLFNKKS
jgi:xylose isomerase